MKIKLDTLAKQELINSINLSGYDYPRYNPGVSNLVTEDEYNISALLEIFTSEYGWRVAQVGRTTAVMDWLQGLPSSITIPFYNHEILKMAKSWGSLPVDATEKQEDKLLENYWRFMANKLCQLFAKVEKVTP